MPEHCPVPPHALPVRNNNKVRFMILSITFSLMITVAFAFALKLFGIPVTVIIPSIAPILMGTITLGYMVQIENY